MFADYPAVREALARQASRDIDAPRGYERDAVVLLLVDRANTAVLFIQKTNTEGYRWRSHIALPGGAIDPDDRDAAAAALRELEEEVGILPVEVEQLGPLGHFQTRRSQNDLQVVVGRWLNPTTVKADPREIARVFEVPLMKLLELHTERGYHGESADAIGEALVYPVNDVNIWGVTARIVHRFLEVVYAVRGPWRSRGAPHHPYRCC